MAIIQFFVYSNLWVALCATSLCLSTQLMLGHQDSNVTFFVFFSTLFSYNFQAILSLKTSIISSKIKWIKAHLRVVYFFLFISVIISFYSSFNFNSKTIFLVLILCTISFFYSLILRNIPFIKIFLISISWGISTVALLVFESESINLDNKALSIFIGKTLFVSALIIPFDIRDSKHDSKKLRTIPQIFGNYKAKLIAILFLFAYCVVTLIQYFYSHFDFNIFLGIIISCSISSLLIYQSNTKKSIFFFSFWIEGLSVILFIVLLLVNRFLC